VQDITKGIIKKNGFSASQAGFRDFRNENGHSYNRNNKKNMIILSLFRKESKEDATSGNCNVY
jgi:hypothetical protein